MGVDTQTLRFLIEAKRSGACFDRFLMIGRQGLHVSLAELRHTLQRSHFSLPSELASEDEARALREGRWFIEPVLRSLGAREIHSLDYSAYEQATILHDLNQPIPDRLNGAFSCVFDGGSLEHVFQFPQAIKNCMEMVSVGGHFLGVEGANNFMGHGFYQFSPELYYRIFSKQNGYEVEEMIMCEHERGTPFYRVSDPEVVGHRVECVNTRRTYLMVRARKLRTAEIFAAAPQQSDYVAEWSRGTQGERRFSRVRAMVPERVKRALRIFKVLHCAVRPFRSEGFREMRRVRD